MPLTMCAAAVAVSLPVFSVMAAPDIRIKDKIPCQQSLYRFIRIAGDAPVKPDASIVKRILRARSDPAADQRIHIELFQKSRQGAMPAAVRFCRPLSDDPAFFCIIDLKLFRVPKMLVYISVFICDCNSHDMLSLHFRNVTFALRSRRSSASFPAKSRCISLTETVISALDHQLFPIYDTVCNLLPGVLTDLCHSCPGNIHPPGTLLMSQLFQVDQAYHLILIDCKYHHLITWDPSREKLNIIRL